MRASVFFFMIAICTPFLSMAKSISFNNPVITDNGLWSLMPGCSRYKDDQLRLIKVPVDYSHPEKELSLYYAVMSSPSANLASEASSAPTVIYVPGGPSESVMTREVFEEFDKLLDMGFNVILFEPRGAGCNILVDGVLPPQHINSDNIARDLRQIVLNEHLSNYYIWGHSYGTLTATLAADLIRATGAPRPKALVLEGTMGQTPSAADTKPEEHMHVINKVLARYPQIRSFFEEAKSLEQPPTFWGHLFVNKLDEASYESDILGRPFADLILAEGELEENVKMYLDGQSQTYQENLSMAPVADYSHQPEFYTFVAITCQEFYSSFTPTKTVAVDQRGAYLVDALRTDGRDSCQKFSKQVPSFDAKNYDVGVPTVYFHGEFDRQTLLEGALYHSNNNTHSTSFVTVKEGGHSPLTINLMGCFEELWTEISKENFNFDEVLTEDGVCKEDPWVSPFAKYFTPEH